MTDDTVAPHFFFHSISIITEKTFGIEEYNERLLPVEQLFSMLPHESDNESDDEFYDERRCLECGVVCETEEDTRYSGICRNCNDESDDESEECDGMLRCLECGVECEFEGDFLCYDCNLDLMGNLQ